MLVDVGVNSHFAGQSSQATGSQLQFCRKGHYHTPPRGAILHRCGARNRKRWPVLKIGIVGGTGYTGAELLRLLARHPHARAEVITSRGEEGKAVADLFPNLRGYCDLRFTAP